jgi:DNA repair protein RecN (Recombination protein N)
LIEALRIQNVAIVEEAELEFGPGLNALTGETGAGKSIVLGALALLAGARADPGSVREGSEGAAVEALFRTGALPELEAELVERGFEVPDHELVVRRTLTPAGRSRARLAGQLVPVAQLAELFAGRIEVSSQHDSQSLRRAEVHGLLLDRVGELLTERRAVAEGYAALRALEEELAQLRGEAAERARRQDFLAFQVREIEAARLDPREGEALRAERSRLAHAARLRGEGAAALALLAGDPMLAEQVGAADLIGDAARRLAALARLDPALAGLAERTQAAGAELSDAARELERYLDACEADPARLGQLEERLHQIEALQRKYGADVEEVLRFRDAAAAELARIGGADLREAAILRERERRRAKLEKDAAALSTGRARAARALARRVEAALRELAMPQARFAVALEPADSPEGFPCGPLGREAPEFLFSANAGESPRALRKVASGGELSRVLLALKNAARGAEGGMVLVFDEVDAGVSGRAAERVGRALAELAAHHQVLCITHLPQVAAWAGTHFRVEKRERGGRTRAQLARVEGEERVEEIARMAGGESVGEATRRHARELLAASARQP